MRRPRDRGILGPLGYRYDIPEPRLCLACQRCHHLFGLARTPKSINKSWSLLIAHLSGGLLFGREVKQPASFRALRPNKPVAARAPRRSPRPRRTRILPRPHRPPFR